MAPATRTRLLLLSLAALVVRLAYIAAAGRHEAIVPGTDSVSYETFARLMLSGWGWVTEPLTMREPLYSAFMAAAYALPTPDLGTLQVFQAVLGALAVAVLYAGLRPAAGEGVATVAAVVTLFNPHFVAYTPVVTRENLVIFLLAAFTAVFLDLARRGGRGRVFLCALVYVLLAHTDVRFLPLIVVVPVMLLIHERRPSRVLRETGWAALFFVLLMIPYQVRASVAMDRPVVITERFLGKWMLRAEAVASGGETRLTPGRDAWLRDWEAARTAARDTLPPAERAYFEAGGRPATGRAAVHGFLFLEYWRFARFSPVYRPYPDGRFAPAWSLRHNATSALVVVPFLLLLPVFVALGTREMKRAGWPLLLFLAAHTLMHVFVHARERYRIPMEVFTGVIVALALAALWERRRGEPPENASAS